MAEFVKPLCPVCGNPMAEDARDGWRHACPVSLEPPNWTCRDGRTNTSSQYDKLVNEVANMIRDEAWTLLGPHGCLSVAGSIMAQLAWVHNVGPLKDIPPEYWPKQEVTSDPAGPEALTGQD